MRLRSLVLAGLGCATVLVPTVGARELKPATLKAFERYVQLTEARQTEEVEGRSPFLWLDRQPERDRSDLIALLKKGKVVSARLETREGKKEIEIADGKVHHWIGTVLLPSVTLDRATEFVQNYERYPEIFAPMIVRARILSRSPDRFDVAMRTSSSKYMITVVIDADYGVDYKRLSASRLYTRSTATHIFQVESAGEPGEKRVPGETASRGYLWRLNTYCWFEERTEGTYEQCESMSLTSNPGWFVNTLFGRIINGIPRDTLEFTLGKVRAGVGR